MSNVRTTTRPICIALVAAVLEGHCSLVDCRLFALLMQARRTWARPCVSFTNLDGWVSDGVQMSSVGRGKRSILDYWGLSYMTTIILFLFFLSPSPIVRKIRSFCPQVWGTFTPSLPCGKSPKESKHLPGGIRRASTQNVGKWCRRTCV